MQKVLLAALFMLLSIHAVATDKRAMTFEDMFTMKRISNLSVSADGQKVLYRVRQATVDNNSYHSAIYMTDLESGETRRMTPEGENAGSPQWHPKGDAFIYTTGGQIYIKYTDGSAPRQITAAPEGASGPRFSADGSMILFASTIKTLTEAQDHSGMLIKDLLYRQWNEWRHGIRNHVFMVETSAHQQAGKDITPGDFDSPPLDLGSSHDYTFSPDGKEVAFVKNTDEIVAMSTNNDIFVVDLETMEERRITTNRARDAEPHYSPDGRYIAYVAMARAGFEADQHVIHLYDRQSGEHKALSDDFKYDADDLVWSSDSKRIYFLSSVEGAKSIHSITLKGKVKRHTDTYTDKNLQLDPTGKYLVFTREATHAPADIYKLDLKSEAITQVTKVNEDVLAELEMNPWESFSFKSENGADVQGFVIKPPGFDASKKYPMIYLIHGGPQGMWGNLFHYRWNAQMFAAPGNVVVMVNPHGSKGYGQPFCDAVSRDWGGLPYRDLMKGVNVALQEFPFIDGERMSAAGASYGGYMINWIAGQNHPFKALISHNGVFNMPSMAFATEELWFSEWEFGGTYYDNPELYEKWSPHHHVSKFSAPMLVIHSEKDFRVPINQGIELFTAHRRRGLESQWLYFPDEDHFVSKPHNARMWWRTVLNWADEHTQTKQQEEPVKANN